MEKKIENKSKKKIMKKSFFEIKAPLTSTKISLYNTSPDNLDNKTVVVDLTKNLRGKRLELKLRIKNAKEGLSAVPEGLYLTGSYVRKMIRKGTDYVEDSFLVECKEGTLQIKPFLMTRKRVSRLVLKELRNAARKHLEDYSKVRNIEEIFSEIINNKIQKQMSQRLKKIYPLAVCEIRTIELKKN